MANRALDWFRQAEGDLAHAELSRDAGQHDWSCFAAQQAAEMAVKALHLAHGREAWGHLVRRLLEDLPPDAACPPELLDRARVLDGHYVPSRYANGHPEGSPRENYGPLHSVEAIEHARAIVEFVRARLAAAG